MSAQQSMMLGAMNRAGYSPDYIEQQLSTAAQSARFQPLPERLKANPAVLLGCLAQAGQIA